MERQKNKRAARVVRDAVWGGHPPRIRNNQTTQLPRLPGETNGVAMPYCAEPDRFNGPDGTPRLEAVVDDDGVTHLIQGIRLNGEYVSYRTVSGFFFCLCNKHHPGPEVLVKNVTCLECLVVYNG
jgi:hypothetical protein